MLTFSSNQSQVLKVGFGTKKPHGNFTNYCIVSASPTRKCFPCVFSENCQFLKLENCLINQIAGRN